MTRTASGHLGDLLPTAAKTGAILVVDAMDDDSGTDLADELSRRGNEVTVHRGDLGVTHFERRFAAIVVPESALGNAAGIGLRAFIHSVVQHLEPGGTLLLERTIRAGVERCGPTSDHDALLASFELEPADQRAAAELGATPTPTRVFTAHRRSNRFNVHDLVHEARRQIARVSAVDLARALAGDTPPTVLDTRTDTDRARIGVIPSSIHVPRTVTEWHTDPANGYLHPTIESFEQHLVVVCNGGFSSSLAAANLVRIGYVNASDLIGGVGAWSSLDLPLVPPTHSHLDPSTVVPSRVRQRWDRFRGHI